MYSNQESEHKLSMLSLLSRNLKALLDSHILMNLLVTLIVTTMVLYIVGSTNNKYNTEIIIFAFVFSFVCSTTLILMLSNQKKFFENAVDLVSTHKDAIETIILNADADVLYRHNKYKSPIASCVVTGLNDIITNLNLDDFSRNKFIKHFKLKSNMACYLWSKSGNNYYYDFRFTKHNNRFYYVIMIFESNYITFNDLARNFKIPIIILDEFNKIVSISNNIKDFTEHAHRFSLGSVIRDGSLLKQDFITLNFYGDVEQDEEYLALCPKTMDFNNVIDYITAGAKDACIAADQDMNLIKSNKKFPATFGVNTLRELFVGDMQKKMLSCFEKMSQDEIKIVEFTFHNQLYNIHIHKPGFVKNFNISKLSDIFIVYFVKQQNINLDPNLMHSQRLQAIGQLAGGVAHDFNNLITATLGFCDLLLLKHGPHDRSFEEIMQIKQNSTRAANLVKQLLAFSRKQTLTPEIVDITECIDEITSLISRLIGDNIVLDIYHGRGLWLTKIDKGQFEQVMINLAVNARDAIGSDSGQLIINTSNVIIDDVNTLSEEYIPPSPDEIISEGEYIKISVKDTGCGIPSENIQKIFEPFFSTKEVGSGTGLGLATVYGIIRQSSGYLYVKSKLGEGTEFMVLLKRHHQEIKNVQIPNNIIEAPLHDLTGDAKIMIIEDEDAVRHFATQALELKGYVVLGASNGDQAREIFEREHESIDMIISDVMMPGSHGPKVIQELTRQKPDLNVIFISGYGEDVFLETYGSENRNFHFLAKPFNLKQLAEKVREVLLCNVYR